MPAPIIASEPTVAVIVPFRDQREQDRRKQLAVFVAHMASFLRGARTIEAARSHGKATGRLVSTVDEGVRFHAGGFDLICYSGDVWVLGQALSEAVSGIRGGSRG